MQKSKNEFNKLKSNTIGKLYLRGLKEHWILATIMFIFMALVAYCTVFNIRIAQQLVILLSAKNMYSLLTNDNQIMDKVMGELVGEGTTMDLSGLLEDPQKVSNVFSMMGLEGVIVKNNQLYTKMFMFEFTINQWIYYLIGNILFIVVAMYIAYLANGFIAQYQETALRQNVVKSILEQDIHFFKENKTGNIISSVVKDVQVIGDQLKVAPIIVIYIFGSSFGALGFLTFLDWKISLSTFALIAGVIVISVIVIFAIRKPVANTAKIERNLNNDVNEKIQTVRLVKSTGTWNEEKSAFIDRYQKLDKSKRLSISLTTMIAALLIGGIGSFTLASIIFGQFIYSGESLKILIIFSTFTAGVFVMVTPLFQLKEILEKVNAANQSLKNIDHILNSNSVIDVDKDRKIDNFEGQIEFRNVDFSYPDESDKKVISNINLRFEKNKKYAFVGPSGCGKSTIAKLLLRFYDVSNGELILNGNTNIKDIDLKSWLANVGYVDQEPQIISGTFTENITYGVENWSMDEVYRAAKKARIHDLIMNSSEGYNTVLFESGSQLSGGQKQRLVIARMFLKNPKLLILDEATSALDNLVEAEIQSELEKLMVGRTTISIAHRLSTIKDFDKIFVLEPNKGITDCGTFDQLVSKTGIFKTLFELSN
ncbi:ATP-binding cassette, subfamily B, bacterial [Spiroplasma chinense]|uniref:ATP-binding cassette, subfamily B, bacterial n=1 Tax=Spiroplasma chinense TaxID=216932 RepID=A0A5B9Y331_9MOLU|nr:ABC transporter ATP-binding protein [Spiroplasma chinense]QEH61498.1 ATP-binding cassette, subfamily B, bacterial [Spiroplasma chinense]